MDEDTTTFYNHNLGITPRDGMTFAFNYLLKILDILFKYKDNQECYQDMTRSIRKLKDRHRIDLLRDKKPADIVELYEATCKAKPRPKQQVHRKV